MNKIILITIVIVFIGVGGYFLLRGDSQILSPASTRPETENSDVIENNGGEDEEAANELSEEPQVIETAIFKEFNERAFKWAFDPAIITVNKGDKVKLNITSEDVTHGFNLPVFGVNENLAPGKTVSVEFTADKTGTFIFVCSVFCGAGHSDMAGQLIVK